MTENRVTENRTTENRRRILAAMLCAAAGMTWIAMRGEATLGEATRGEITDTGRGGPPELKIGIIGLDTSHVTAFTRVFNDPKAEGNLAEMRVVAAFPAGSDIPASKNRVAGFTEQIRGMGIEIVDSIAALLAKVDVVLLESVDGRTHLEQVEPVFAAGKRVFIDKPLAGSLHDVLAIDAMARKHGAVWFSSSSLRHGADVPADVGKVVGCDAWGPCTLEPTHSDLFWYGIHGVETLFTIMGPGCERGHFFAPARPDELRSNVEALAQLGLIVELTEVDVLLRGSGDLASKLDAQRQEYFGAPGAFDADLYKERNLVERFFNKIKHLRRIAMRYCATKNSPQTSSP